MATEYQIPPARFKHPIEPTYEVRNEIFCHASSNVMHPVGARVPRDRNVRARAAVGKPSVPYSFFDTNSHMTIRRRQPNLTQPAPTSAVSTFSSTAPSPSSPTPFAHLLPTLCHHEKRRKESAEYSHSSPLTDAPLPAHRSSRSGRCPICIIVVGRVAHCS